MTSLIGYSNIQYDAINLLKTRIDTLKTTIGANKKIVDDAFGLIQTKNNTQDERLLGLTGAFGTLTSNQATSSSTLTNLESERATLQSDATTYETKQANLISAFGGYDSRVSSINTSIDVTISDALALKGNTGSIGNTGTYVDLANQVLTIDSYVSLEMAKRVTKAAQQLTDDAQDALQAKYSDRILAIAEFIKVFQKTYNVDKPNNGGTYTFELSTIQGNDKLAPPIKILNLLNKKSLNTNDWGLTLKLSEYGYNELVGKVSVTYVSGTPGATTRFEVAKADFNPTTREVQLRLVGVREGTSVANNLAFPFNIVYEDVKQGPLFSLAVTQADFASLTLAS